MQFLMKRRRLPIVCIIIAAICPSGTVSADEGVVSLPPYKFEYRSSTRDPGNNLVSVTDTTNDRRLFTDRTIYKPGCPKLGAITSLKMNDIKSNVVVFCGYSGQSYRITTVRIIGENIQTKSIITYKADPDITFREGRPTFISFEKYQLNVVTRRGEHVFSGPIESPIYFQISSDRTLSFPRFQSSTLARELVAGSVSEYSQRNSGFGDIARALSVAPQLTQQDRCRLIKQLSYNGKALAEYIVSFQSLEVGARNFTIKC